MAERHSSLEYISYSLYFDWDHLVKYEENIEDLSAHLVTFRFK